MEKLMFLQTMLHYKAQHLAVLNNSFLPWLEDDSQSNLRWDSDKKSVLSRPLENGAFLEFNFPKFLFIYHGNGFVSELPLTGRKDMDLQLWIKEQLEKDGQNISQLSIKQSYKLPKFTAQIENWDNPLTTAANQLANWRTFAQKGLEKVASFYTAHSEIRIWPHHFDTGMLLDLGEHYKKGAGLGYAIKDNVCNTAYFYTYAWSNTPINYSKLSTIKNGHWHFNDWKGAVMPVNKSLTEADVFNFYSDATNAFVEIL